MFTDAMCFPFVGPQSGIGSGRPSRAWWGPDRLGYGSSGGVPGPEPKDEVSYDCSILVCEILGHDEPRGSLLGGPACNWGGAPAREM